MSTGSSHPTGGFFTHSVGRRPGKLKLLSSKKPGNIKSGIKELEKAALVGDMNANIDLGVIYAEGKYVPIDYEKSYSYYLIAAKAGDPTAQVLLAMMAKRTDSKKKPLMTENEAFSWALKSAQAGLPFGEFWVAHCYREGLGIDRNESLAFKWANTAVNDGVYQAMELLAQDYEQGVGVAPDWEESKLWEKRYEAARPPETSKTTGLGAEHDR